MKTYRTRTVRIAGAVFAAALLSACGEDSSTNPASDPTPFGPDSLAPAAIHSLIVQTATKSTLALQWVSPGDDGDEGRAAAYDIRHHGAEITEENWGEAMPVGETCSPKPAGNIEILVVQGLYSAREYFFAIKASDEVDNRSAISNCASGTTLPEYVAPARIDDLAAQATGDTEFLLIWTATGDDGMAGRASAYDVRYSESPIGAGDFETAAEATGEPVPSPSGEPDSLRIDGLNPGTNYYFALKVGDELPNWSAVSNSCVGLALSENLLVYPTNVTTLDDPVTVVFRTTSADQRAVITVSTRDYGSGGWTWTIRRHLVDGRYAPGAHTVEWDFRGDEGEGFTWTYQQVMIDFYLDGVWIAQRALRRA